MDKRLIQQNDRWTEKEIREIPPITKYINNIKYFVVTLTKQEKDLYENTFKSLKKEIEEHQKIERCPMVMDK